MTEAQESRHRAPRAIPTASRHLVRLWLAAFVALAGCATFATLARAQPGPVVPPPNLSEEMLRSTPVIPSDELAGLRQFSKSKFDAGHVAWTMAATIAALFMLAPGLGLFYCGLANKSNVSVAMVEYLLLAALLSLGWVLWTYSLAFSRNENSFDIQQREIHATDEQYQQGNRYVGGWNHFALQGFDPQIRDDAPSHPLRRPGDAVPHLLFMAFQLGIFIAAVTPLTVILAEGMKLWGRMLLLVLWGTLVYAPIAYWIWGGGWRAATLDFAGGIVMHVSVGCSALALALAGLRPAPRASQESPQSPNLAALGLGTLLFWGGSMVCNSGHALVANAQSVNALVATHLAGCTGLLGWVGCEWLVRGKSSLAGICCGAMAGLFAIAPACGYVAPQSALLIGLAAGVACHVIFQFLTVRWSESPLMAPFALQGIGGGLGVLLTGVFATAGIAGFNRRGDEIHGLLSGNSDQLLLQAMALASAAALAVVGTWLIAGVVRLVARPAVQGNDPALSAPHGD